MIRALLANWHRLAIGAACGLALAFTVIFAVLAALEWQHVSYSDYTASLAMYGLLMGSMVGGAAAGFRGRA